MTRITPADACMILKCDNTYQDCQLSLKSASIVPTSLDAPDSGLPLQLADVAGSSKSWGAAEKKISSDSYWYFETDTGSSSSATFNMRIATLDNDYIIVRAGWSTSSSTCYWSNTKFTYSTLGSINGDKLTHTFGPTRRSNYEYKTNRESTPPQSSVPLAGALPYVAHSQSFTGVCDR